MRKKLKKSLIGVRLFPLNTGYGHLALLAEYLNRLPENRLPTDDFSAFDDPDAIAAWREAEKIVSTSQPDSERFNALARQHPVNLYLLKRSKEVVEPTIVAGGFFEEALFFLWRFYFLDPNRNRLRRCQRCRQWFADRSRANLKKWCFDSCKNRFWNKSRRRGEDAFSAKNS